MVCEDDHVSLAVGEQQHEDKLIPFVQGEFAWRIAQRASC
jgi:hypothetical protein